MSAGTDFVALLREVGRAGVYHLPLLGPGGREGIIAAAETCGYAVFRIDLSGVKDKAGLLATLSSGMAFPEWFGTNWDALADCLADLSWRPAEGYLVILEHCDLLHSHAADDFVTALQLFQAASDEWREQDVALWCLVDMQADGINWLPGL